MKTYPDGVYSLYIDSIMIQNIKSELPSFSHVLAFFYVECCTCAALSAFRLVDTGYTVYNNNNKLIKL